MYSVEDGHLEITCCVYIAAETGSRGGRLTDLALLALSLSTLLRGCNDDLQNDYLLYQIIQTHRDIYRKGMAPTHKSAIS